MTELIEELERAASVAWEHVDDGTNEQYHLGKARGLEQAINIARAQRSRSIPQPFSGPTGDTTIREVHGLRPHDGSIRHCPAPTPTETP